MSTRSAFGSLSRRRHQKDEEEDPELAMKRDLPRTGYDISPLLKDGNELAAKLREYKEQGEAMRAARERRG